jgi:hypothetical protein
LALPLFAVTLFVSAFLLFLVQPMIGKMILPKLGGTPQVWNTCMLFFQVVLLAGYAYTHNLSTRLPTRKQLVVHAILLLVPFAFLLPAPFDVRGWFPDPTGIAVVEALRELAILVGVPFFVVSTSAPLLQRWFVATGHPAAKDPYFLYGASNLGSLLSLLFYPLLFEPWFTLRTQADLWLGGYVGLLVLMFACVVMVIKSPGSMQLAGADAPDLPPEIPVPPVEPPPQPQASTAVRSGHAPGAARGGITRKKGVRMPNRPAPAAEAPREPAPIISRPVDLPVTWARRLRWILLAAVPSSLMLGVTSYISTDLSPFPLIWVVPLALYLLSFILVYLRWPVPWTVSDTSTFTPHSLILYFFQPLAIVFLCWIMLRGGFNLWAVFIAWGGFFATALACHGELARDRPDPKHLTEYFLLMSVGGAVGGVLNGIVAPMVFDGVYEFYIAVAVACFVRPTLLESNWLDNALMNAFPGLRDWAREQSDQVSQSLGRAPDGSTYVLSYTLDVILGLFMGLLAWFLSSHEFGWNWWNMDKAFRTLKFIGFPERAAEGFFDMAYYGVIFGIPLVICALWSSRPLRFGLGITALLCVNLWFLAGGTRDILFQGRTYFGVLRVLEGPSNPPDRREDLLVRSNGQPNDPEEFEMFAKNPKDPSKPQIIYRYTYLMHGTTYHGRNYIYRPDEDLVDLSRLATTYYHRYGPVGAVMEKFNWLPGPQNTFWADARGPTATVGLLATLGASPLPYDALLNAAVSEPPYATIGLGTGTMASYCRPYQHLTFYEIDRQIREFSLPPRGNRAFFTYLLGTMRRGANLEVIMGDARLTMEHQLALTTSNPDIKIYPILPGDKRTGAEGEDPGGNRVSPTLTTSTMFQNRDHYYKAIEVDAFSSDAIPVHLITKEAIEMYLNKITYDGVVMVHTSNRHLDLVQPVAKIVEDLDEEFRQKYTQRVAELEREYKAGKITEEARDRYKEQYKAYSRVRCLVGKDSGRDPQGQLKYIGLFGSEYVMVFYDEKYLKPPQNYAEPRGNIFLRSVVKWGPPTEVARFPWTDDFSNLVKIMRW